MEKSEFDKIALRAWENYVGMHKAYTKEFYEPDKFSEQDHEDFNQMREKHARRLAVLYFKMGMLGGDENFRKARSKREEFVDGITTDQGWVGWDFPQASSPRGMIRIGGVAFQLDLEYSNSIDAPDKNAAPAKTISKFTLHNTNTESEKTCSVREQLDNVLHSLQENLERPPLLAAEERKVWITDTGHIDVRHWFCNDEFDEEMLTITVEIVRAYADWDEHTQRLGTLLTNFAA